MKEFNDDMFIVINKKRFAEMGEEGKNAYINFSDSLSIFVGEYEQITGKTLNQKYLVCNQDEPYSEQVKAIILGEPAPNLPALLERCKETLQEVSAQKGMVRTIEQYKDFTGGEPSLGTCKTLGQLKTIADKASTLLADLAKAGVK